MTDPWTGMLDPDGEPRLRERFPVWVDFLAWLVGRRPTPKAHTMTGLWIDVTKVNFNGQMGDRPRT